MAGPGRRHGRRLYCREGCRCRAHKSTPQQRWRRRGGPRAGTGGQLRTVQTNVSSAEPNPDPSELSCSTGQFHWARPSTSDGAKHSSTQRVRTPRPSTALAAPRASEARAATQALTTRAYAAVRRASRSQIGMLASGAPDVRRSFGLEHSSRGHLAWWAQRRVCLRWQSAGSGAGRTAALRWEAPCAAVT
eukprot:363328-Chlamydomonas_euryale.AAC.10